MNRLTKVKHRLLTFLRDVARNYLRLEVKPSDVSSRSDLRLMGLLRSRKVTLVLDIGANNGQFASQLYRNGYSGKTFSFEAIPSVNSDLRRVSLDYRRHWTVMEPYALSNSDGVSPFRITSSNASSSFFPMTDEFRGHVSFDEECEISVPTKRLDTALAEYDYSNDTILLKIDVQGAEKLVLEGAPDLLMNVDVVHLELSCEQLYKGQAMYFEVDSMLRSYGFRLWDCTPFFREKETGRLLQFDGTYLKS